MQPDRESAAGTRPARTGKTIAVIAGSGLSSVGERFVASRVVPFADIEGVEPCTVEGHRGEVRFCAVGEKAFVLVLGRKHVYEGDRLGMDRVIRWLAQNGVTDLLAVSAAGGLTNSARPGELVVAESIIDLQNLDRLQASFRYPAPQNPERHRLTRRPHEGAGEPFPRERLSAPLMSAVKRAALEVGVHLGCGTLACCAGPAYESPAEVRMLQAVGADVATMSAGPEVRFAAEAGLNVAVIAAVTNAGTGMSGSETTHGHVLKIAGHMGGALSHVIEQLVTNN